MAAHSNRSPSPIGASRPINPNLRNPENNSGIRRSFSTKPSSILTNSRRFEPATPANSPSDFVRRHSVDSYPKEKENCEKEQNLRGSKCQPSAKGSKNFMTPTISASSKFSPSPKKKVLVERNDPVRTSMSLSDGKALFYSTNMSEELELKPEISHHESQRTESSQDFNDANLEKKEAAREDLRVSKSSKRVTFDVPSDSHSESLLESVITESGNSCLNNEISCSSNPSTIAPQDADPSLPPYDPKTNYLYPRPQFLHYKPNPRIEILLNKEKGLEGEELKQLEDSIMAEILSESFSDSERSEDSQNEDLQKEEVVSVVSADIVVGIDEEIEDITHASELSESLQSSTCSPDAVNSVEEKQEKPRSVSRGLLCFSIILMFLSACGSVFMFHSPAFNEIALNELRFSDVSKMYHQSRIAASARMNFDRFSRHVNQFSASSVSFIFNLANELGGGETNIGSPQFMNLSNLQSSGHNLEVFLQKKEGNEEEIMEEHFEEDDDEFKVEANAEMGVDSDEVEFEAQEVILDGVEGDVELEEIADNKMMYEEETANFEVNSDGILVKEYGTGDDALDAENVGLEHLNLAETEPENFENMEGQEIDNDEKEELGMASQEDHCGSEVKVASASQEIDEDGMEGLGVASQEDHHGSEMEVDEAETSSVAIGSPSLKDNKFPVHYAAGAGLSTLIASLFAAAAYTYHHKRIYRREANIVLENPSKLGNKQTGQDISTYSQKNWQDTEVGETETCPSEMSSFRNNTAASYSRKEMREEGSEAQSTERKKMATRKHYSKREPQPTLKATTSAAISSSEYTTGSPSSYGSFTTFERIPIKNVNGDDEVITPVRRSSRLRNHHHHQVVSP